MILQTTGLIEKQSIMLVEKFALLVNTGAAEYQLLVPAVPAVGEGVNHGLCRHWNQLWFYHWWRSILASEHQVGNCLSAAPDVSGPHAKPAEIVCALLELAINVVSPYGNCCLEIR